MNIQVSLNRRDFLTRSALAGAGLIVGPMAMASVHEVGKAAPVTAAISKKRKLGSLDVSSMGLGCMSMVAGFYNPARPKADMVKLIRSAVDQGGHVLRYGGGIRSFYQRRVCWRSAGSDAQSSNHCL